MSDLLGDSYYAEIDATRLAIRLAGYRRSDEGVYDGDGTRIATKTVLTISGELMAADKASLHAAIASLRTQCNAEGKDVRIVAGGDARDQILAADCLEGPHVNLSYDDPTALMHQGVTIAVEALTDQDVPEPEDGVVSLRYDTTIALDAEGLATTTERGELRTRAAGAAAKAVAKRPDASAAAVITFEHQANSVDTKATWQSHIVQLATPLPAEDVFDGERSITTAVDRATNRKVVTYNYDYTGSGASAELDAVLAALAAAGGLVSSSMTVDVHKANRATLTATVLSGYDQTALLEISESIRVFRAAPLVEARSYAGTTPLVVSAAQPAYVAEQSGRAVGLSSYPSPADKRYGTDNLAEDDVQRYRVSNLEFETSWRYVWLTVDAPATRLPTSYALWHSSPDTYNAE